LGNEGKCPVPPILYDSNFTYARRLHLPPSSFNPTLIWRRYIMPVNNPSSRSGTLNVSSVTKFQLVSVGAASASSTMWVDELAADIGLNTFLEFMIPDNVSQNQGTLGANAISVQSWNGSSYQNWMAFDAFGSIFNVNSPFYCLDGTSSLYIYSYSGGPGYYTAYPPGVIGSTQNFNNNGSNPGMGVASITYNTNWGTMWRVGIGLRLPSATTDSVAGNYPSDDLAGSQAINKVRIKATVYYANEDTTYAGF